LSHNPRFHPDFDHEEPDLLSRFRTLVLFAVIAALATTIAACGGSSSSEDPQKVIDNATLQGVESGELDATVSVKAEGEEGGDVKVDLSGPFQSGGKENLPELDLDAKVSGTANGNDIDFEGGLTLLSDRAFVSYKGTEYEVDPTTFGFVKSGFERAEQQGGAEGGSADVTACQEAATGLKIGEFIENLSNEGSADVDGTSTTKISGDLNAEGALDAIVKLTENPACAAQLQAAGPLPLARLEKAKGEVTKALKKAHLEVYVGDDDIIRKLAAEVTIEPQSGGAEKVEVDLEFSLGKVNEEQSISAPPNAKPLEQLFQQLGVNPIELLELTQGGGTGKLGSLLEGVTGGSSSGGSSGGGASSGGSGGGGSQKAYLNCLQGAETPADLQKCAGLLQ
jgi:hypothetical protein